MSIRSLVCTTLVVGALGAPALAHFDIHLSTDTRVRTGGADLDEMPVGIKPSLRVFGADLGEAPNPAGFGDEPGFYADALSANVDVGFDFLDALRVWDGTDFDAAASESLTLSKGLDSATTPGTPNAFSPGFIFGASDSSGNLHDHMEFALSVPGSVGVYLLTLQMTADEPGVMASKPIFIVLNNGEDEEIHDAAVEYVESTIPAPGGVACLGVLVGACSIRRTRRV